MQPPFSGAGGASQPVSRTSGPLDAGGQSLSSVPVPDLAASCPSVLEDVLRENLSGVGTHHAQVPLDAYLIVTQHIGLSIQLRRAACTVRQEGLMLHQQRRQHVS